MNFWLLLLTYNVFFSLHGIGSLNQENYATRDNFIYLFDAISQRNSLKVDKYQMELKNKAGNEKQVRTFLLALERHRDDKRNYNRELVRFKRHPQQVAGMPPVNDIFSAVSNEDLQRVKFFVEVQHVSVKCLNSDYYRTPAHIAAYKGNLPILKYLVGVDESVLKMRDIWNLTILHVAVENGPLKMVKFLVDDHKMDIYSRIEAYAGDTPLHRAAVRGSLDIVKYFVGDKKMDPRIVNNLGQPPIFHAAQWSHLNVVKYLYEKHKIDAYTLDREKKNILHMCAIRADLNITKFFLDEKKLTFNVNQRDSLGFTVLIWGALRKRMDFIQYYVEEKHADVNIQDNEGRTMLHHAVVRRNRRLILYLYEHDADFDIPNKKGCTPRNTTDDPSIRYLMNTLET